jgi:ssRNA-specific RNase YbeY (16S rRNA maturation enzyme)
LGYDHADRDEEKVMFDLQESIVKKWESTQWNKSVKGLPQFSSFSTPR